MNVEQVCLIVILNVLVGTFMTRVGDFRTGASGSLVLIAMILAGFTLIWRSCTA